MNLTDYQKHKDSHPTETITRIRNILYEIGIFPIEVNWEQNYNYFSVRLVTNTFGFDFGTNGKGISRELALASAYSEFMERLQNLLLIKKKYGRMNEVILERDGTFEIAKEDVINNSKVILQHLIVDTKIESLFGKGMYYKCISFYDVINNTTALIPELALYAAGSNGMSAGNTPEEAILQGICEIFERYAVKHIFENKIVVPTIPKEELKKFSIYRSIDTIEKHGYQVLVKDCTFSGFLPVLAVIIFNKDLSKCIINFGSDPNFEIALMRCISEAYQGFNEDLYDGKMFNLDLSLNEGYIDVKKCPDDYKLCKLATELIYSKTNPDYKEAFEDKFISNKESLRKISNKLISRGYQIFVKDVSFLNYPSYHTYIPGMSEFFDAEHLISFKNAIEVVNKSVLNLKKLSNEEVMSCISAIEAFLSVPFNKFVYNPDLYKFIKDFSGVILNGMSDLNTFDVNYLLALLAIRIKDYKKAFDNLNSYLKSIKSIPGLKLHNIKYYMCILHYLKLKNDKCLGQIGSRNH